MISRILKKHTLTAILLLTGGLYATEPLEKFVSQSSNLIIKVEAIDELDANISGSPLANFLASEELKAFFAPARGAINMDELTERFQDENVNLGWKRLKKLFPAQALFSMELPVDDFNNGKPKFALIAEYTGDKKTLDEIISLISDEAHPPKGTEVNAYDEAYLGVTLRVEEVNHPEKGLIRQNGWALVNNKVVIADPLETLKETVGQIIDPGANTSLYEDSTYLNVIDDAKPYNALFYLNIKPLIQPLMSLLQKGMNKNQNQNALLMGMTADSLVDALGLDIFESYGLSLGSINDQVAVKSSLQFTEKRGLLQLLAYKKGTLPRPQFIPSDAISSSVSLLSLSEAWLSLENMLTQISPMVGQLFNAQMESYKAQSGLDFRENVVHNFGDVIVTAGMPLEHSNPEAEEATHVEPLDYLFAFTIKDPQALSNYIKTMEGLLAPSVELFDSKDLHGIEIRTLKSQIDGKGNFSYAITNEHLLLHMGTSNLIEKSISLIENQSTSNLWNKAEIIDGFARLPEGASEYNYGNLNKSLHQIFKLLAQAQLNNEAAGVTTTQFCDPNAIPTNSLPYYVFTATYSDERSLRSETIFVEQE